MHLFGLLFRVQEHGVMICCGSLIFMRLKLELCLIASSSFSGCVASAS